MDCFLCKGQRVVHDGQKGFPVHLILSKSPDVATAIDVAVNSKGVPDRAEDVQIRDSSDNSTVAVVKVVVWGDRQEDPVQRLQNLKARFRPHASILFIRHPTDNMLSLKKHLVNPRKGGPGYARSKGDPPDKLRALEKLFLNRYANRAQAVRLWVQFG